MKVRLFNVFENYKPILNLMSNLKCYKEASAGTLTIINVNCSQLMLGIKLMIHNQPMPMLIKGLFKQLTCYLER